MTTPLLPLRLFAEKYRVPQAPPLLVSRARLLTTLAAARTRKLTLVLAPAGFGKTTLVAEYARSLGDTAAWLTLEPGDAALLVFSRYFIAAVARVRPTFGRASQVWLEATDNPTLHLLDFAAVLVEELEASGSTDLVVILDDFHEVAGSASVFTLLELLLRYMPPWMHLVLSGRSLLEQKVATRLLVEQQVGGLGADDLRFQPAESLQWIAADAGGDNTAQARSLVEQTEGWITGIILRTVAGSSTSHTPLAPQIYAYLSTEVLERQPPAMQHFLLRAAVLPWLDATTCRQVLDIADPDTLLATAYTHQLFLTTNEQQGGGSPTYRMHRLFREFLLTHLRATAPQEWAALHRRTAAYYREQQDPDLAFDSLFTIRDWAAAATLLGHIGASVLDAGHSESVERWLDAFPVTHSRLPGLLLLRARLLLSQSQLDVATTLLAEAAAEYELQHSTDAVTYTGILLLRARLAVAFNDGPAILVAIQPALALEELTPAQRAEAQHLSGIGYTLTGDRIHAEENFAAAHLSYQLLDDTYGLVLLFGSWGNAYIYWQQFYRAQQVLEQALKMLQAAGSHRAEARILGNLANVYHHRGDLDQAQALVVRALDLARTLHWHRVDAELLITLAGITLELDGPTEALPYYQRSATTAWRIAPPTWLDALAGQALCFRLLGQTSEAIRSAQQGLDYAQADQLLFAIGVLKLELGAALLVDSPIQALPLLRELVSSELANPVYESTHQRERAIVVYALTLFATGDYSAARATVEPVLWSAIGWRNQFELATEFASRNGFPLLRQIVDAEPQFAPLLIQATQILTRLASPRTDPEAPVKAGRTIIEIYSLGAAGVYRNGRLVSQGQWKTASAKELVVYLAEQGDGVRKEVILAALWPDAATDSASNIFHQTVSRVRAALGADAVPLDDGRYRLNPQLCVWHDGTEALRWIKQARLTADPAVARAWWLAAATLLRHPFTEEWYHDWAAERRTLWIARTHEVYIWLLADAQQRTVWEEAIRWGQRLLLDDPLDETAHLALMRAYAATGRTLQALEQYTTFQRLLRTEYGTDPSPKINRFYQQLLGLVA